MAWECVFIAFLFSLYRDGNRNSHSWKWVEYFLPLLLTVPFDILYHSQCRNLKSKVTWWMWEGCNIDLETVLLWKLKNCLGVSAEIEKCLSGKQAASCMKTSLFSPAGSHTFLLWAPTSMLTLWWIFSLAVLHYTYLNV